MIKYPFQYFFDVKTDTSMQVIKVKAGGALAQARTLPLWGLYKYYKLGKVSVKMVPSVTIPMDPLGLSYDDDDPNSVDPRDMVSPGLIRITNGEDFNDGIVNLSDSAQRQVYNNMLLDRRWFKWNLQTGVKKSAVPLFYNIGQLAQDVFPGTTVNYPIENTPGSGVQVGYDGVGSMKGFFPQSALDANGSSLYPKGTLDKYYSDPRGLFQTGHYQRMGWMPTDAYQPMPNPDTTEGADKTVVQPMLAPCIEADMIRIITPPQYKTSWFFRVYVTEWVYFSGLRSFNQAGVGYTGSPNAWYGSGYTSPDQFVTPGFPLPYPGGSLYVSGPSGGYPQANDGNGDKDD